MNNDRRKRVRVVVGTGAALLGVTLGLVLGGAALAQKPGAAPTADDEVVAKGAFDDDDGVRAARKPETPAQIEVKRPGIWVTSPSPTVSDVKVASDSPADMPCWVIPMTNPPTRLMAVMTSPATASPRTNFAAPSMEP